MHVASLGMYDLPELQWANDALWQGLLGWLEDNGLDRTPDTLDRSRSLPEIWDDPELLLGQTCGFPLATRWRGRLRYVATPGYDATGCEGPSYCSMLVVARDSHATELADLRGTTVAINEPSSNSGCNLLAAAIAPLTTGQPFFADVILTGSHLASAVAVAEGKADIAALDAVTFAHLRRHRGTLTERLRVIGQTPRSPGLPLVTSAGASDDLVDLLCQGLTWAMTTPDLRRSREELLLKGIWQLPLADYDALASLSDARGDLCPSSLVG